MAIHKKMNFYAILWQFYEKLKKYCLVDISTATHPEHLSLIPLKLDEL